MRPNRSADGRGSAAAALPRLDRFNAASFAALHDQGVGETTRFASRSSPICHIPGRARQFSSSTKRRKRFKIVREGDASFDVVSPAASVEARTVDHDGTKRAIDMIVPRRQSTNARRGWAEASKKGGWEAEAEAESLRARGRRRASRCRRRIRCRCSAP